MALPTGPLVVVAWLGQCVAGLAAASVATRLPRDTSAWAAAGFVQVTLIPAPGPIDSGDARFAYAQVDAWGVSLGVDGSVSTSGGARAKANNLAELVMRATEDDAQREHFGKTLTMPSGYDAARVLAAWPMTEPSEVPDDPTGYARVTFDLALKWARV